LHNETDIPEKGWIGFRLIGEGASGRDAYGAVIRVVTSGKRRVRQCHPGGSYLSSSDSRLHFGLAGGKADIITVYWPDGAIESWKDLEAGRYHTLHEGATPLPAAP